MKVSFTRSWTSTEHRKFSLGYEKNFLITILALVFVILKHSLQWRDKFHLDFGPVPEFLLVNSAARQCFFVNGCRFRGKIFIQLSLLMRSLTIFGSAGIWADNLCPASQWKCWKSNIRSSVFNKYIYIHILHKLSHCYVGDAEMNIPR